MISVDEAKKIISDRSKPLSPVKQSLRDAAGQVLAADVFASIDIPAYPQSSMDGYAFRFNDWNKQKPLAVDGEMAAGSNKAIVLSPDRAVRIFTGAAVPDGADTVVMQEKAKLENGALVIQDEHLQAGANVRPKGSEIRGGELALPKGSYLSPAAIGFLAGIGVTELVVYPKPSVSIIITGNELQEPGSELQYGQVYESNSFTLKAALQQAGVQNVSVAYVGDVLEQLVKVLNTSLDNHQLILLTGGISAGDYDFVLEASMRCGVEQGFHKVKQRPGKPLFFGTKDDRVVFGLPGNPSSVLTCFYEYVLAAIAKMSTVPFELKSMRAPLSVNFKKPSGLTHFLKGYYDGYSVTPLNAQESYRLHSFARANCLVRIDEETTACKEGETVEIHLLPA